MTPFSLALVLRFSSVHSLSCVQFFATPRNTGRISRTVMTALSMALKDRKGPRFLGQHSRPPVHHQFPELTQTHAHRVGDAIQQSHPVSSPSPPAHNPSQHHGLFQ